MNPQPLPSSAVTLQESDNSTSDDRLHHIFCDACGDDLALCGRDVADVVETDGPQAGEQECVVCAALIDSPCPRCGDDD